MSLQIATWFPFQTIPEAREFFKQHQLTDDDKNKTTRAGQIVSAYESSIGAWVQFKYMQSSVALVRGHVVSYGAKHNAGVAIAASTINSGRVCGVAPATRTASYWGWIQTGGPNVYRVLTDKGVIAGGKTLKKLATTGGVLAKAANSGSQDAYTFGRALQSDSGSFMAPGKFVMNADV